MSLTADDKKYVERMQQVVRVLREVRDQGRLFDLGIWGTDVLENSDKDFPEGSCGTVMCAIGWVGLDPWFRRRGFCSIRDKTHLYAPLYRHQGYMDGSWEAVIEFFGMSRDDSYTIFTEGHYDDGYTVDDVINKVQGYIQDTYGDEHVVA